jgi:hypothetical protein
VQEYGGVMSTSWREVGKRIGRAAVCSVVLLGLLGCSQSPLTSRLDEVSQSLGVQRSELEEVSAPAVFGEMGRSQNRHDPQIKIVGLKPDATIEQKTANIRFEVEDFPIFKDPDLGLGPHLQVLLDDQPYIEVYDAKQSITFTDLTPGTHTVRAFASYPWHESFKAPSAFDQLTFNVFASTQANQPDPDQPLLTYSQPQGVYGAEPIMVDYLITPPLSSSKTKVSTPQSTSGAKSKVQITVNGQSFITEELPPIYLKGFKSGVNWVKVALLSSSGKAIPNAWSETVQLVTLKPGSKDTVSRLVRGELNAQDAEQIISLEASQRRAAQKLEALSAPKIIAPTVPAPTAVEPKPTNTETVTPLSPVSTNKPSLPQNSVTRPSTTEIMKPQPVLSEPISIRQGQDRLVKPTANLSPAQMTEPEALKQQVPEKIGSKSTSLIDDNPVQSFLKRFRQKTSAAAPSQLLPPNSSGLEFSEVDKGNHGGDRPIPPKSPAASPLPVPAA